jgi:predicted O-methyltransferase YrrM
LEWKYDLVFIDANKRSYRTYLELLILKLNNRALIIADNIISHRQSVTEYLTLVRNDSRFRSIQIPLETGLEITIFQKQQTKNYGETSI